MKIVDDCCSNWEICELKDAKALISNVRLCKSLVSLANNQCRSEIWITHSFLIVS